MAAMKTGGRRWVRPGLIMAGTALMAFGFLAAALEVRTEGIGPFVFGGLALIVLGVLEERLTQVELSAFGAGASFSLLDLASDAGPAVAQELSRLGLNDLVTTYAVVNGELRDRVGFHSRVQIQDGIIAAAARRTGNRTPNGAALHEALQAPSPASRTIALGVATSHLDLMSPHSLKVNLLHSLSGNEQFHALLLLEKMWPRLDESTRTAMSAVIAEAPYIADDPDRRAIANRLTG
jgi:hypothetical protein